VTENNHIINIISDKYTQTCIAFKNVIENAVSNTLSFEKVNISCTVNINISDDKEIREYNQKYRGIDKATDVLSFPMQVFNEAGWDNIDGPEPDKDTGELPLGDIIISMETVKRQAVEYNNKEEYEAAYLLIHSTLHLLGYDHDNAEKEKIMHKKGKAIMTEMGFTDND